VNGDEKSQFNADGSKKEKKLVSAEFVNIKDPSLVARRE
jgi:hypothetical protein